MNIFHRARTLYILHRHAIPHALWDAVIRDWPILQGLTAVEKAHLRELSSLLMHEKNINGVQGFDVAETMRVAIAAQVCLPILYLGFGITLFRGWRDIIVYPEVFRVKRDETDAFGVVHPTDRILSGESWLRGPLILSWRDIEADRRREGRNVIVHEIAHKLDMLNGSANGMPPLHLSMPTSRWTEVFSQAYRRLQGRLEHHRHVCIDPYAATSPAECFAVFSEYFFSAPATLKSHYPEVYRQLQLYYRQDTLKRLTPKAMPSTGQPLC